MVIGVETAGLVLAAFPLVVSGLTHYVDGLRTINSWRGYRRQLKNYTRILNAHKIHYENTIELLFDGIVESDEELAALMKHPAGDLWREANYDVKLKRRLNRGFDHFFETIKHMDETLEEM